MIVLEQKDKKKFLIEVSYIAVVSTLIFIVFKVTFKFLTPFVIAVIIASFMQKPAVFLSKKIRIKKEITAAVLTAGVYLLLGVLLSFAIYETIYLISSLVTKTPDFIRFFSGWFSVFYEKIENLFIGISPEIYEEILSVMKDTLENFVLKLSGILSSFITSTVKNIPSVFISSIVALVASCYIAKDYDKLKKFLIGIINDELKEKLIRIRKIVNETVFGILRGYLLLFLITFLELTLGFFVIGIKYAPVIAFIISVVDFLPVLGTGILLIPWGLFSIMTGNSFMGFAIIIIYLINMIVRNFAEPKILGKQMGINPLFTLFSMFLGLKFFGFWGLLIFPLALIVTFRFYNCK